MNSRNANPFWRWIVCFFSVVVFLVVAYAGCKSAYADHLESSTRPEDWGRATQIEPANGNYWYKLGLYRELDIDNGDLNKAIEYFSRAATIDPRSAAYLMSLGGAYESAGQPAKAMQAYQAAVEVYPLSSETHWRYGSFLLRRGDTQQAYSEMHRAVLGDRTLVPLVVSRVWLERHDVQPLVTTILPPDIESNQQALDWFCEARELDAALAVWKRLANSGEAVPISISIRLVDSLLGANRGDDARQVWQEALSASGNKNEASTGGSLVFNGGFEFDSVNGGFDWHVEPTQGVKSDYDTSAPHSGKRALRLKFDGAHNISYEGVWQTVAVEPGRQYHFEGYLRTSAITTDSGIRFRIVFPGANQAPILLDSFTGDNPWTAQTTEFTIESGVHQAKIIVYRPSSQRFDNKLAGTAWVDDVSITPVGDSKLP
jgi:tetratricopeptide (TPR) repeat protein